MDLPTYTNIWRIEKRLYKLYDFNLPMPLPIVQLGVFVGVFVTWVVFLQLVRVPFHPPWHVLYLVPPVLVTYLATRPVLEGKRLTELLLSQLRYLAEPRVWCRLGPAHEPERATITGTVWRRVGRPPTAPSGHARRRVRTPSAPAPGDFDRVPPALVDAIGASDAEPAPPPRWTPPPPEPARDMPVEPAPGSQCPSDRTVMGDGLTDSHYGTAAPPSQLAQPVRAAAPSPPPQAKQADEESRGWRRLARAVTSPGRDHAFAAQASRDAVAVRDASFDGSRRVVVVGCAAGAGQTVTALLLGHTLAARRRDRCVAVDAGPSSGSLTRRSRMESPETLSALLDQHECIHGYLGLRAYTSQAGSGLEVIASDDDPASLDDFGDEDYAGAANVLDRYYAITVYDPAPSIAGRLLPLADQLVLVSPPGAESDVAATLDWVERCGHARLISGAVVVARDSRKKGKAGGEDDPVAQRASQRCGATVRVPWDGRLQQKSSARLELDGLPPPTRNGFLRVAAEVAAGVTAAPERGRQEVRR